jgi:hypothetical protein
METRNSSLPKQKESHMRSKDCNPSLNFTPRKKYAESAFLLAASTFTSGKLQDF